MDPFSGVTVGIISVGEEGEEEGGVLEAAAAEYGVEILGRGVELALRQSGGRGSRVNRTAAIGDGGAARPSSVEKIRYVQIEKRRQIGPSGVDSTMLCFR